MFRKKRFIVIICILIGIAALKVYTDTQSPYIKSESAILLDMTNDEVLYEKNVHKSFPAASMSKLMTIYIVLDNIHQGTIRWTDEVVISELANDIIYDAVRIPVNSGDALTVDDLFRAMVIPSANNATISLAEYIAGSEAAFTQIMNDKATELGLSEDATFFNATGLPYGDMENKMSAKDVAMLAKRLIEAHPDFVNTSSLEHSYVAAYDLDLYSTNKMLSSHNEDFYLAEVDGLKTGYTSQAGYCFVGTAVKGDQRLISVIMNSPTDEGRFSETKQLLSFGFGEFTRPTMMQFMKLKVQKLFNK